MSRVVYFILQNLGHDQGEKKNGLRNSKCEFLPEVRYLKTLHSLLLVKWNYYEYNMCRNVICIEKTRRACWGTGRWNKSKLNWSTFDGLSLLLKIFSGKIADEVKFNSLENTLICRQWYRHYNKMLSILSNIKSRKAYPHCSTRYRLFDCCQTFGWQQFLTAEKIDANDYHGEIKRKCW